MKKIFNKRNQTYIKHVVLYFFAFIAVVVNTLYYSKNISMVMDFVLLLIILISSLRRFKLYESMNADYNQVLNELNYNLKENELLVNTLKSQREDLISSKKEMYDIAYYDSLTGLPKKHHFEQYVNHRIGHIDRACMLKIDIKDFKLINSVYGSQLADRLIVTLGSVIKDIDDQHLYACRYSSDEFIFWYESDDVTLMRTRLNEALLEYQVRCRQFFCHFKIGFHMVYIHYPADGSHCLELVDKLSIGLKYAKESKSDLILAYNSQMEKELQEENRLREIIEEAISKRTFEIYFQEKNNIQDYNICGLEALARLKDESLGDIKPDEFIPLIHKYHYTESFERQIIGKVFSVFNDLMVKYGEINIAINISPSHISSEHFYKYFSDALMLYRIKPNLITLEVTEDILSNDICDTIEKLSALRALGVKIAIDNFGSRYSSLNHLIRLPFDELKVDRAFIKDIQEDKVKDILRFIINFEKKYDIDVVASGIESGEELEALKKLGYTKIQGFLYQVPEPIETLNGNHQQGTNIS